MKNRTLRTVPVMLLFAVFVATGVHAQSVSRIGANVPFDFVAGESKFKAGDYSVKRIGKNALLIRNADLKTSVIVQALETVGQTRRDAPPRLVFRRYGHEYFLAQVWLNQGADGQGLYPSTAERQRAGQMAKNNAKPREVEVTVRGN